MTSTSANSAASQPEPEVSGVTLRLTEDNPIQTQILSETGEVLYTVTTSSSKWHTKTAIKRGSCSSSASGDEEAPDESIVATLKWKDVLPDKVVGEDQPQINHCKFLKSTASIFEISGKSYSWIGKGQHDQPQLQEDGVGGAIVRFENARRNLMTWEMDPATLWIHHRALDILDTVVVTFLVLEKNRRAKALLSLSG